MPEEPHSIPSSPVASGEFNFTDSSPEATEARPRIRKRTLKAKPKLANGEPAASASAEAEPQPEATPPARTAIAPERPAPAAAATRPATRSATPPSSASSTHTPTPGLYYNTGARRERENNPAPAMKTSPSSTSSSSPASSAPISSFRPAASASAPGRAATVSDFRANIDRQAREQKSVGSVLSYVVYALGAFLVISVGLAGYGAYTLSRQIHSQSVTISDLDSRYAAQMHTLSGALTTTNNNLADAQAQIRRDQELILQQQTTINKLITQDNAIVAALRQERSTRASETSTLRARVRTLEEQPRFSQ